MRRRIRVDADARRRWLVPEVVQTSGMDCGPAVLACLLGGYGIRASYGRLREACHTGVNGTSIDALEDVANLAGLEAQQTIAPVEHLALDCAELLPAIVLTRQPTGLLHFVLVWSRHGSRLQVMDPAVGRRWVPVDDFLTEVWLHEFAVPSVEFEAFAASPAFRDPLRDRIARLGLSDPEIDTMFESADSLAATCTFDAAARQAAHVGSRQDGSAADLRMYSHTARLPYPTSSTSPDRPATWSSCAARYCCPAGVARSRHRPPCRQNFRPPSTSPRRARSGRHSTC